MVIIAVDGNQLVKVVVKDGPRGDELNVVSRRVVVRVDPDDLDAGLAVVLHESAATDVEEDLVDLGVGDGVDRAKAIRLQEFTGGVPWYRCVTSAENQKSFVTQIL